MADEIVSTSSMLKNVVISMLAAIAAYYYYKNNIYVQFKLENVRSGLLAEESWVNLSTQLPIAAGFGSCLDLKVNGVPLMNKLGLKPPKAPKYHQSMTTLQDVAEMFAFYLEQGAAAERFIPMPTFKKMVEAADKLNGALWTAGGNAPVMGERFVKDGFTDVTVSAHASKKLASFFSSNLKFLNGFEGTDDVHLIMEFKVGETWGKYKVTRANRFIVHSDQNNPYIKSLKGFQDVVREERPRLAIISALQMLDNFPFEDGVREARMSALADALKQTPKSTLLHFEMASFSEAAMMKSVLTHVLPFVDSMGMNEQELPNVVSMFKHGKVIQVSDSNPRTATVLDDMREVYRYYQTHSERGLSRMHVHTLAFQAILTKKNSEWKNNKGASARASLTANRHVCNDNGVDVKKSRLIMDDSFSLSVQGGERIYFNEMTPVSCWDEDDYEICVAPVLVCTDVKQTAGGGDNISAAGLMAQI